VQLKHFRKPTNLPRLVSTYPRRDWGIFYLAPITADSGDSQFNPDRGAKVKRRIVLAPGACRSNLASLGYLHPRLISQSEHRLSIYAAMVAKSLLASHGSSDARQSAGLFDVAGPGIAHRQRNCCCTTLVTGPWPRRQIISDGQRHSSRVSLFVWSYIQDHPQEIPLAEEMMSCECGRISTMGDAVPDISITRNADKTPTVGRSRAKA
jgi:hypothetical protein